LTDNSTPAATEAVSALKEHWQIIVTILLLLIFSLLAWYLIASAGEGPDIVWQRRIFVFSGVEALLFTAVGWLFGREVSRSAVAAAEKTAADAKQDAETARGDAQQQGKEATDAKVAQAEERTRAETAATVVDSVVNPGDSPSARPGGSRDAGLGGPPEGGSRDAGPVAVVDLQALFRRLYPDRPSADR